MKISGSLSLDSGIFQCIAKNDAGNIQTAVKLIVLNTGNLTFYRYVYLLFQKMIVKLSWTCYDTGVSSLVLQQTIRQIMTVRNEQRPTGLHFAMGNYNI